MKKLMLLFSIPMFLLGLTACSKSGSTIDATFLPVTVAGCGSVQSDTDDSAGGFGGGTPSNVTWDGAKIVLSAGQSSGTLTSRVFSSNSCSGLTPWLNFRWTSTLPYLKPLPPGTSESTAYSALPTGLMANILGLWHMDETSYNGTAGEIIDSSGMGNSGSFRGTNNSVIGTTVTNTTGRFNGGADWRTTPTANTVMRFASLPTMTNVITFQLWFNTSDTTAGQVAFMRNTYGWEISTGAGPVFNVRIDTDGSMNQTSCSSGVLPIEDGNWHHLVLYMNNGNCRLYFDGVKKTDVSYTVGATGFTSVISPLHIGFWCCSAHPQAIYDEAALWTRPLSDAEILDLYRRGVNRVKFQVRSCTTGNCADNPTWLGPDNTNSTFFSELNNNSNQNTGLGTVQLTSPLLAFANFLSLVLPTNSYFQYLMTLQTDNTTYSPDVVSVGVSQ